MLGFLNDVSLWKRESAKRLAQNEEGGAQVQAHVSNERVQDLEEVFNHQSVLKPVLFSLCYPWLLSGVRTRMSAYNLTTAGFWCGSACLIISLLFEVAL